MPDYQKTIYELLEDAVDTRLAPLRPATEVQPWPDNESEFNKAFEKGRISFHCHSAKADEQLATDVSSNEEVVTVHLLIQSRSRKGQYGIFDLKRSVDAVLNGFKPAGWKRFTSDDFHQAKYEGNVWFYNYLFKTVSVNQQQFDDTIDADTIPGLADALNNLP